MRFNINYIAIKKELHNLKIRLFSDSLTNIRYSSFKIIRHSLFNIQYSSFNSKFLLLLMLFFFSLFAYSQNYRFSITSSNAYFSDFNKHKVLFSGYSASYFILNNRFGFGVTYCHYFPKTYYGQVGFFDFIQDKISKTIPVYAKGAANSFAFGASVDFIRTKSEKTKLSILGGFLLFDHTGNIDNEPFLSTYGTSHEVSVSSGCVYMGLQVIHKLGYIPIQLSLKKIISIDKQKYSDIKIPGYFEINIGICFPIIKSPPPTEIIKINF